MKIKNNRGFTIVELLTSFSLASVVMILLFNILLAIKEDYIQDKTEVELASQIALLANTLNEDAGNCTLSSTTSNTKVYTLKFTPSSTCDVSQKQLSYSESNGISTITYDGEKFVFPDGVSIQSFKLLERNTVTSSDNTYNNSIPYTVLEISFHAEFPISGTSKDETIKVIYKK